jgi:hypothetical protein
VITRSVLTIFGITAALAAAGCGGASSGGTKDVSLGTTPTHHHSRTSTPVTPTTTTATSVPQPTNTVTVTSAPVGIPRCLSSHLALSLGSSQGAAGSTYTPIVLTNTGSSTCELHGFPGVSFVDASGHLIGKPARETAGAEKTITLKSGSAANSTLHQPQPGNFDPSACQATTADRLRVYPPGETNPLFIKDAIQVCSTATGRTDITALASGTGS